MEDKRYKKYDYPDLLNSPVKKPLELSDFLDEEFSRIEGQLLERLKKAPVAKQ